MKQQISPAVATAIIVVVVAVVGFFIWRGASSSPGGDKPVGAVGNASPFAPGGSATGKGGVPAESKTRRGGGPPTGGTAEGR